MNKILKIAAFAVVALALVAGASSADAAYSRYLTIGSTGADVSELQTTLESSGYLVMPAGVMKGYFGALTKNAVMKWQAAVGLPATGYFGPMSIAKIEMTGSTGGSTGSTGGSTSSNDLEGGAGSITVTDSSKYSTESVKEGEEDAEVLAFKVEADDESDISVTSIKVELEQTTAASSEKIDDYMESVSVWYKGKMVGEADADSFSENSDVYTKSIKIKNAVIKAGDEEEFVIAVTALNNLDSGDIDADAFTADVLNVRFEDADEVVTTEDTSSEGLDQTFDFEDLATSGDLEVKFTESSDNPDADSVEVDDTSDTNDVLLLAMDVKSEGSDTTIDEISFAVSPVGANANVIVKEYHLLVDGEEIDSMSAGSIASAATGTVTFSDLEDDFAISEGDKVKVELVADINDTDGTFGNGDSISASFNTFERFNASIDDENGDSIATGDRTGAVTGESQTFYTDGIAVEFVSSDAEAFTIDSDDNDRVELEIVFKVTAFGQDAYIPSFMTPTVAGKNATAGTTTASTTAPTTASGVAFNVQSSDTGLVIGQLGGTTLSSTADEETNSYKVNEGSTETFTLLVKVTNAATSVLDSASIRAILSGVNFASTDSATGDFVYTSNLTDDFKTPYATIAN